MDISNEYSLFASFSEYPIAPFEGAPNYMMLNSLNSHLNTWTESVHCNLDDRNLSYLILTSPPDTYTLLSTLPFAEPANVGPTLAMTDSTPTSAVLSELV